MFDQTMTEPTVVTTVNISISESVGFLEEPPEGGLRRLEIEQTFVEPTLCELEEFFKDAVSGAGYLVT